MKKLTSLLIGCSLALAGAALAQEPVEQQSPPSKGKRAPEKAHATQAQPGANAPKPEAPAEKQHGARQKQLKSAPGTSQAPLQAAPGTNVSGQSTGAPTNEPAAGKGRKPRAHEESANAPATGTDVSGAKQQAEQHRKGMKEPAGAAKTSATPAAAAGMPTQVGKEQQVQGGKHPATEAGAAPSVSAAGQQDAQKNVGAKAKKPDPQQVQEIKSQHANFRALPKPQQVPAVTFNQNHRIEGSDRWQGPQYEVFRSYHSERHDQGWYRSHYNRVELIGGGYYFFNNGFWAPAWGYDPSAEYYAYDGPIYVGHHAEPPDKVIADVQGVLQQMGYYTGEVDGLLGPLTREALTAYQADQGLATTAAIDQPTLDSLGMG